MMPNRGLLVSSVDTEPTATMTTATVTTGKIASSAICGTRHGLCRCQRDGATHQPNGSDHLPVRTRSWPDWWHCCFCGHQPKHHWSAVCHHKSSQPSVLSSVGQWTFARDHLLPLVSVLTSSMSSLYSVHRVPHRTTRSNQSAPSCCCSIPSSSTLLPDCSVLGQTLPIAQSHDSVRSDRSRIELLPRSPCTTYHERSCPPSLSPLSSLLSALSSLSLSSCSISASIRALLCLLTLLSLISSHRVLSDRNRFYHISALCLRERVHPLYKKIDGAVISSKSENNLDCTITFQTDTILQKFMLRFEKLALDCNDHLYIYDGAHTIGNHKAHLSCRSTRAEVGTIYTQGNFLTLHYTTDAYSKADNGFRLIITAYKDSKNYCREHRCANQFCISRDLVCDGVNHCGDNSDESYYANCQEYEEADTIIGLDPMIFIAIVASVFVACLACVISVSVCLCRRERMIQGQRQRIALQQQYQTHQLHDTGLHAGTTPILGHNNSYNSKLDGCTMITSLDGYGATRNGGLVNSFTHTTLPNNFATLPHLHNHNHHHGPSHSQLSSPHQSNVQQHQQQQQQQQAQSHVRFGTLPVRGNEKPPPPYPGNYFNHAAAAGGNAVVQMGANGGVPLNGGILTNGGSNGGIVNFSVANTPPHSSQQAQVQTQVIYTAK